MADNCKTYKHPILRDGWSQDDRRIEALLPESFQLMELQAEEWLNFAYELGAFLRYHNLDPSKIVPENWQSFWPDKAAVARLMELEDAAGQLQPHLALYLTFLKLLEHSRTHLNKLGSEHLNFYFRRILRLSELPYRPDQIHLAFELAKRVDQQEIEKGTLVDAGKDANGQPLYYAVDEALVVNRASVADLRQIYYDEKNGLLHAPIANSADGLGADLPEEDPQWPAFGHSDLPKARIGFALAAQILNLKEGRRVIWVGLKFKDTIAGKTAAVFNDHFSIFLTGEKEWLGPFRLLTENQLQQDDLFSIERNVNIADHGFYVELDDGVEAVSPYLAEVHGERYNTEHPIMRLVLNEASDEGADNAYDELRKLTLKSVEIAVEVYGLRDLSVENDNARLDPAKPFIPFGPMPKIGSNFFVGSREIFSKNWQEVRLNIDWKDKPESLEQHYRYYLKGCLRPDGRLQDDVWILAKKARDDVDTFDAKVEKKEPTDYSIYVTSEQYFTASTAYRSLGEWIDVENNITLFEKDTAAKNITINKQYRPTTKSTIKTFGSRKLNHIGASIKAYQKRSNVNQYIRNKRIPKPNYKIENYREPKVRSQKESLKWSTFPKSGFLKLQLNNHFFVNGYHAMKNLFPNNCKLAGINEPYIPEIKELKVDYRASVIQSFDLSSPAAVYEDFTRKKVQLFHDQVFGQTEEHPFLKGQQRTFTVPNRIRLLPNHVSSGELLIGLQDAKINQIVSLLIEVAAGSENPEREALNQETGIKWYILCSDEWKPLEGRLKLKDTTNQFLRSGIVRFVIPEEATDKNARLEDGLFWIKARLTAPLDSVGRLLGVYTQAVSATFVNQANDLGHLRTGLAAGSATKLKQRLARIKKVEQPYDSFGGRPEEEPAAFYQRVSERLRHKDRAVTIWDYEHLILQEFPQIYKVKCLSHTQATAGKAMAPGWVSMIIIPRIHPDNAFDRLRPRAGQQLLTEVEQFLAERISLHARFDALNAEFEEVQLDFGVRYTEGIDPDYHQEKLREALIRFLSPWAADPEADIQFGGTIYRSEIIRFLENLSYVDFIDALKIIHFDRDGAVLASGELKKITASNSRAILVSARYHTIAKLKKECP